MSAFPGSSKIWASRIYTLYDRFMILCGLPARYCSQCERKIRHYVYHLSGITYCQECIDEYVGNRLLLKSLDQIDKQF